MLKWTTTVQKSASFSHAEVIDGISKTPLLKRDKIKKRKRRRSTLSNKENIITSTPLAKKPKESLPYRYHFSEESQQEHTKSCQYASTLPTFEEEYSPSTVIPGKMIAMRGILPDLYLGHPRYIRTNTNSQMDTQRSMTKMKKTQEPDETINLSSSKMGDATLDKLINAILDSTRKDKKRRPKSTLTLRRRSLLRNTSSVSEVLSPSYTPADDPASDLSFSEFKSENAKCESENTRKCVKNDTKSSRTVNSVKENSYFEVGLALPSVYV